MFTNPSSNQSGRTGMARYLKNVDGMAGRVSRTHIVLRCMDPKLPEGQEETCIGQMMVESRNGQLR
jgi:hypothetical protein